MYYVVIDGHTADETTWVLGTWSTPNEALAHCEQSNRETYHLGLVNPAGVHIETR